MSIHHACSIVGWLVGRLVCSFIRSFTAVLAGRHPVGSCRCARGLSVSSHFPVSHFAVSYFAVSRFLWVGLGLGLGLWLKLGFRDRLRVRSYC